MLAVDVALDKLDVLDALKREAPELDATVAALQAGGFFEVFPIPPEAYMFDIVFDLSQLGLEGKKVRLDDSWDDVSPRFVVDYAVTDEVMVFGSLTKGYKAGGYNSVEVGSRFDNEDVWNLEGGVKSLFADLGLIVNASAFYYQYLDRQAVSLVTGVNGSGIPQYVVDTADEEAYGLDADLRWQPLEALGIGESGTGGEDGVDRRDALVSVLEAEQRRQPVEGGRRGRLVAARQRLLARLDFREPLQLSRFCDQSEAIGGAHIHGDGAVRHEHRRPHLAEGERVDGDATTPRGDLQQRCEQAARGD
mgnify:CR=1 FL=1